jgi:hypothetical protein
MPKDIHIHGFLGQGLVTTSDNVFYGGKKHHISTELTEIGLNASWRTSNSLRLTGQFIFRNAGDLDAGNHFNVDYLLADTALFTSTHSHSGIRIGRYKNPLGFYNKTRDVPMTRPSIFLPQSIYFDRVRNAQLSTDGLEFYHNHFLPTGTLTIELGVGSSKYILDETIEYAFLGSNTAGDIKPDGLQNTGRLLYQHDGDRIRLALSFFTGDLQYDGHINNPVGEGKIDINMTVMSAEYNIERWHFTSEYLIMDLKYQEFNPLFITDNKTTSNGWYVQTVWDIQSHWSLLARYDRYHSDNSDNYGREFAYRTGAPAHLRYNKDRTIGITWDIRPDLMLRAEYHKIKGTSWLSDIENPNIAPLEKKWNLLSLYLSWQF